MLTKSKLSVLSASTVLVLLVFASAISIGTAHAAPSTITAYKSTIAVNINGAYSSSQWTDTATLNEPTSGITFAVKQNTTGWLFLMIWKTSTFYCSDANCFGGIEIGFANNTQPMGSPTTPTIMILASTSFKGNVDEFIASGESTPTSVESLGYKTQSVCGLTLTGTVSSGTYTVMCYRPFKLAGASPYDMNPQVGQTIQLGFAVGEFSNPGDHAATDMSTYTLAFSSSTYGGSSSSSTSSSTTSSPSTSSTTTTSTSTTKSTTSTTTSTTTTTSSTSTSTSSSSSTTSKSSSSSTSSSTSTTSSSTAPSSSTSSSTTSTSTFTSPATAVSVATTSSSYTGIQSGVISGKLTGATAGYMVTLTITSPAGTLVFSGTAETTSSGSFNDTFYPGVNNLWVSGTYTVKASYETLSATSTFSYTPVTAVTSTATVVSTVTSPTTITSVTSVTGPASTVTTSVTGPASTVIQTQTQTQTTTVTKSSGLAGWVYAVIIVMLLVGIAVGYVARNMTEANRSRPATRPVQ